MPKKSLPGVLVYSDLLLPPSATFIVRMAESLSRYRSCYVGLQRGGLATVPSRTYLVNPSLKPDSGKRTVREALFQYLRWIPSGLRRQLIETRPALVHAQFGTDSPRAEVLARGLNLPLVIHFRGHDVTLTDSALRQHSSLFRRYLRQRERIKARASLFIAISRFVRRRLEEQGFPSEKIVTHFTGTDLNFFQPDCTVPRQPVVLFVGRLVRYKGCEYLIRAMVEVQKRMPEMELVVLGDGILRASLERLAASTLPRYRFLDWTTQESTRDWMNRARILAIPSITERSGESEGLGNVALEAHAMGLPVVGHHHGGIPEAVISGKTGILVPEKDTAALAGAVLELATDQRLWDRFSVAGQEHVRRNFDIQQRMPLLEDLYDQVLEQWKARALHKSFAAAGRPAYSYSLRAISYPPGAPRAARTSRAH